MLTREDVIAVASRLFAVFLVVLVLRALAQSVGIIFGKDPELAWIALGLLLYAVVLVIAALLWFFPLTIARRLLPAARDSGTVPLTQAPNLQALAFSVLGAWILATALSDALYWLVLLTYSERTGIDYTLTPDQVAGIVATIGELLIGVYLLLGSKGLAALLHRFRYAGS